MRTGNGRVALRQKDIQPLPALTFIYRKTYFCGLLIRNGQVITPVIIFVLSLPNSIGQSSFVFFWIPIFIGMTKVVSLHENFVGWNKRSGSTILFAGSILQIELVIYIKIK
jgi:hypothetical protein